MTDCKDRKVRNRYHVFVRREFSAAKPDSVWEVPINVPFDADELVVRDIANADDIVVDHQLPDGQGGQVVVGSPNKYTCVVSMDGVGELCSFTNQCYVKLDTTFKLNGRSFGGLQRFVVTDVDGDRMVGGTDMNSFMVLHLEFILYEK